jgi:hypothetical protein
MMHVLDPHRALVCVFVCLDSQKFAHTTCRENCWSSMIPFAQPLNVCFLPSLKLIASNYNHADLKEIGEYEETLIVVTADHGHGFDVSIGIISTLRLTKSSTRSLEE